MPSLVGETKLPQQNVNPLKAGNSDYSRVFPQHITQYLQENQRNKTSFRSEPLSEFLQVVAWKNRVGPSL